MKKSNYVRLIAGAIFFSLALLQTAGAAIRPSVLTLSPLVGAHFFSSEQNLEDAASYGLGIGYNFTERLATEAIISYVPTETASGVKDDVDYTSIRLDLLYHFPLSGDLVPYVAFGAGDAIVSPDKISNDTNFIVGYGGGAKYFINDALALRCDVRHLLDINDVDAQRNNTVLSNFIVNAGIFFQFGGREETQKASVKKGQVEAAPAEKAVVATVPEKIAPVEKAEVATASEKTAPVEISAAQAVDSDSDGVADHLDLCSGTAVGVAVDGEGCPLVVDTDRDGVVDAQDRCPETPATTVVDARGCPVPVAAVAELPEPVLAFSLVYPTNKADVTTAVAADMEQMLDFVKANAGRRFIVEGHTDSVGGAAANMKLSLSRAEKIRTYILQNISIPASSLEVRAFGESSPVADNNAREGRRQNRRVVIIALPQ